MDFELVDSSCDKTISALEALIESLRSVPGADAHPHSSIEQSYDCDDLNLLSDAESPTCHVDEPEDRQHEVDTPQQPILSPRMPSRKSQQAPAKGSRFLDCYKSSGPDLTRPNPGARSSLEDFSQGGCAAARARIQGGRHSLGELHPDPPEAALQRGEDIVIRLRASFDFGGTPAPGGHLAAVRPSSPKPYSAHGHGQAPVVSVLRLSRGWGKDSPAVVAKQALHMGSTEIPMHDRIHDKGPMHPLASALPVLSSASGNETKQTTGIKNSAFCESSTGVITSRTLPLLGRSSGGHRGYANSPDSSAGQRSRDNSDKLPIIASADVGCMSPRPGCAGRTPAVFDRHLARQSPEGVVVIGRRSMESPAGPHHRGGSRLSDIPEQKSETGILARLFNRKH